MLNIPEYRKCCSYGTAGLTVHIQGRRFRDGSSNRQDKILPEAAYSHFHPEREPDETHHAGISDSRCIQICF